MIRTRSRYQRTQRSGTPYEGAGWKDAWKKSSLSLNKKDSKWATENSRTSMFKGLWVSENMLCLRNWEVPPDWIWNMREGANGKRGSRDSQRQRIAICTGRRRWERWSERWKRREAWKASEVVLKEGWTQNMEYVGKCAMCQRSVFCCCCMEYSMNFNQIKLVGDVQVFYLIMIFSLLILSTEKEAVIFDYKYKRSIPL